MDNECTITFLPDKVAARVEKGTSISRAANEVGIELRSACGGKGTCGRCAIRVREGKVHFTGANLPVSLRETGYITACQSFAEGNAVVEVPLDSRREEYFKFEEDQTRVPMNLTDIRGFDPVCVKLQLNLPQPSLQDNSSDLARLTAALKQCGVSSMIRISLPLLRRLPEILRSSDWRVTVTLFRPEEAAEILAVEPGDVSHRNYGLAIDVGTTTVVVNLVDMDSGMTVDESIAYNRQSLYGDDVITRIIHASEDPYGLDQLHQAVLDTINGLINDLADRNSVDPGLIQIAVAAGNTAMSHLFLGLSPKYMRLEPYIPAANTFPTARAGELGLAINPEAPVLSFPSVAGYVGGDIVAGVLSTCIAQEDHLTLLIDIGTNGEMVLGNRDWLISCACSAGPAFEGGGIAFGMRAARGAIEGVTIDPHSLEVSTKTVGSGRPVGICGSGLIEILARLRQVSLIDRTGRFEPGKKTPRLRKTGNGETEFVLVWGPDTLTGTDIVITENDIRNVIRSKGAVFAGIRCLLKAVGLDQEALDRILIAGQFGNRLNIANAVEIGLLPDLPIEKFRFVANTSLTGARLGLVSSRAMAQAEEIAARMTYQELSVGNNFMEEFIPALFLPHTDLSLFPSLNHQ